MLAPQQVQSRAVLATALEVDLVGGGEVGRAADHRAEALGEGVEHQPGGVAGGHAAVGRLELGDRGGPSPRQACRPVPPRTWRRCRGPRRAPARERPARAVCSAAPPTPRLGRMGRRLRRDQNVSAGHPASPASPASPRRPAARHGPPPCPAWGCRSRYGSPPRSARGVRSRAAPPRSPPPAPRRRCRRRQWATCQS